jgi:hypothetical protein
MPFQCNARSEAIQKPQGGLFTQSGGETTPPFELKGQPLSNPPEPLQNSIQLARKRNAETRVAEPNFLADSNYYQIRVNTPNIIGPNPNTTLRYDEKSYKQEFIAIHRNIWFTDSEPAQVSLVFTDSTGSIFHICIPLSIQDTNINENDYLKYWLYRNRPTRGGIPLGMTANELLHFREGEGNKVNFLTLEYCLNVNSNNSSVRYTLCLFENALKINRAELPSWFTSNPLMNTLSTLPNEDRASTTPILKKSFDEIINFMFRGRFYRANSVDTKSVSTTNYFSAQNTQNSINPTYYSVTSRQIAGTQIKKQIVTAPGERALQNIKCYPIDLVNQVDQDGNIVIDENTNKPLDVKRVRNPTEEDTDIDPSLAAELAKKQKENEQRVMFWIIFGIVLTIMICIIIAIIVYFLRGKSYSPMGAPTAVVAGIATG